MPERTLQKFAHFDKKMQTYEVGHGRAVHNFYLFFKAGNTYCKEMLNTVDLLIKIAKRAKYSFVTKSR
jgi:hypothetical protein